jgi:glycosyltransferase involved in cell wall biosynthesis
MKNTAVKDRTGEFSYNKEKCVVTNQAVRPELIFWLDGLPHSIRGVLRCIANDWGNKVSYLCARESNCGRNAMGWQDGDHGDAEITILSQQKDAESFVKKFIRVRPGAIHICNGFRSLVANYTRKYLLSAIGHNIVMWSERPGVYEGRVQMVVKRFVVPLLYRNLALRYAGKVRAYMVHGTLGVNTLSRYGWNPDVLFPFMYESYTPRNISQAAPKVAGEPLRMLYVGQFSWRKGVDVIKRALENSSSNNWQIDFVGQGGEYKPQIIEWSRHDKRVSYVGVWPSKEVIQRITQYDLCLVPSRFDGWGCVTNEAIHAGVGVIVTDAAASFDLVKASGAGMVIPAGDACALRTAVQQVADNNRIADDWKRRAQVYSHSITSIPVARYFMDVLEYSFLAPTRPRPVCQWL